MRYHRTVVLALVACTAIGASSRNAHAQLRVNNRYAQNTAPTMAQPAAPPAARSSVEELPVGQAAPGQYSGPSDTGGFVDGNVAPYYSGESCGPSCGCPEACGDPCCGCQCGQSCGSGCCDSGGGQWFVTADYLAVRAHFSEATAWMQQTATQDVDTTTTIQDFHQLDYDVESSFRIGGGYRLCCCGEEIGFNYTKLRSSAEDSITAPDRTSGIDIFVPFNLVPLDPDVPQSLRVRSSVDVDSFDLEWRKTIPLGGSSSGDCGSACGCGECGNACGCGDTCCGRKCPAWDITWSGGVRGARVDWDRDYFVFDPDTPDNNTATRSDFKFTGAGPRFGVEGRRYFGRDGWFSVFMKGNISLLLGEVELETQQVGPVVNDSTPTIRERFSTQEVIPVTEIEAGASASVTCHSTFSAGYLISSWHDLGMRDQAFVPNVQLITHYDDANIMSFDGFFARYEFAY